MRIGVYEISCGLFCYPKLVTKTTAFPFTSICKKSYKKKEGVELMRKKTLLTGLLAVGMSVILPMLTGTIVHAEEIRTIEYPNPASGSGVTVAGTIIPNDETGIPDKALYEALAKIFDSNLDGVITEEEVDIYYEAISPEYYENLDLSGFGICDLTGINKVIKRNNVWLNLSYNQIVDISPLMCDGIWFDLSNNLIENLEPLRYFSENKPLIAESLNLENNKIKNIPTGLNIHVESLILSGNQITDISSLAGENALSGFYLFLSNNQIEDISPLMNGYYGALWLDHNNISVLPDNIGRTRLLEGDLIEDSREWYMISLKLDGNNITEAEARAKLPEEWINFVTDYSGQSWFDMQDFIKDTPNGEDTFVVEISDNESISKETFAEILEQNKEKAVVIQNKNNVTFTFPKGEMQPIETMDSYNFGTTLYYEYENLPEDLKENANKDTWICSITYQYSGKLPAKADIRFYIGTNWANHTIYYSYYKENGSLDFIQTARVDENGFITVSQDHCSSYIITSSKPASNPSSDDNETNTNSSDDSDDSNDDTNNNSYPIHTVTNPTMDMGDTTGIWKKDSTGWWYQKADSSYPIGCWLFIRGKWYLFDNNGYMLTGWQKTGNHWYYLNPVNGDMEEGWKRIQSQWYYLNPVSGDMAVGWKFINNHWYFLTENGNCLLDTITPDGYKVDQNGAWIK